MIKIKLKLNMMGRNAWKCVSGKNFGGLMLGNDWSCMVC